MKAEVNHKDMNKLNNLLDNLEWVTAVENNNHFRNHDTNGNGKTSGRAGTLYQGNTKIGDFRSLQQAKIYCRCVYHCSLSTIGDKNINWHYNLIYLRHQSKMPIEAAITTLRNQRQATVCQIKQTIQTAKGTAGTVYHNGNIVGHFHSIREANLYFHCTFKKKQHYYITRDFTFIPD